jgi:hypothetical protein
MSKKIYIRAVLFIFIMQNESFENELPVSDSCKMDYFDRYESELYCFYRFSIVSFNFKFRQYLTLG